ncbi:MAG: hypothetical protein AB7V08_14000 [Elusimicrobiales bacterium]
MPTADNRNDPIEFERLPEEEVAAIKAERADRLATRNEIDDHRAKLRAKRFAEESVRTLELEVAGRAAPGDRP